MKMIARAAYTKLPTVFVERWALKRVPAPVGLQQFAAYRVSHVAINCAHVQLSVAMCASKSC